MHATCLELFNLFLSSISWFRINHKKIGNGDTEQDPTKSKRLALAGYSIKKGSVASTVDTKLKNSYLAKRFLTINLINS